MDYSEHNDELAFKLQLRKMLTRQGVGSVLDEVAEELRALASFLEDSDDYPAAERYRNVASAIEEQAEEAIAVLNEK